MTRPARPDVPRTEMPRDPDERIREFLRRLAQTRGNYGRDQIRALTLQGWPSFGEDVDDIDGIELEGEAGDYWAVAEERDAERARAGEYALQVETMRVRVDELEVMLAEARWHAEKNRDSACGQEPEHIAIVRLPWEKTK